MNGAVARGVVSTDSQSGKTKKIDASTQMQEIERMQPHWIAAANV